MTVDASGDALVTVADAARRLGVTPEYVRRQLRDGRLPGVRDGRAWKVVASSLSRRDRLPSAGSPQVDALLQRAETAEMLRDLAIADARGAEVARLQAEVATLRAQNDQLRRELGDALAVLQQLTTRWTERRTGEP